MSNALSTELLRKLAPINLLTTDSLEKLAQHAVAEKVSAGAGLSAADYSGCYVYVLSGALALTAQDQQDLTVAAGSHRALEPLFGENPPYDRAKAIGTAHVARVDRGLFHSLRDLDLSEGCEVTEVSITDTENRLFQAIYAAYNNGDLQIPPMPEVAARLARMANDADIGLAEISKVVQADPAVAGAIMQAANSALYCAAKPVGDVKSAVVRLGMALTRSLATSFALRQTFHVANPVIKRRMRTLWEHSVDVSALSFVLARKLKGFDPERALLAGLLHDIGAIPILSFVERAALNPEADALEETLRKLRSVVGLLVAGHWGLDSELTGVIGEVREWTRESGPKPDICDIVQTALHFQYAQTPQAEALPPLEALPAYNRLGLQALDSARILEDTAQQIAAIKVCLNG